MSNDHASRLLREAIKDGRDDDAKFYEFAKQPFTLDTPPDGEESE